MKGNQEIYLVNVSKRVYMYIEISGNMFHLRVLSIVLVAALGNKRSTLIRVVDLCHMTCWQEEDLHFRVF